MVDNCYGEFVETIEPTDVGADLIVGSLIKNPGGGLAPIGGYMLERKICGEMQHTALTSRDLEEKLGCNTWCKSVFYQGFFLAPTVTQGIKRCYFCSKCL